MKLWAAGDIDRDKAREIGQLYAEMQLPNGPMSYNRDLFPDWLSWASYEGHDFISEAYALGQLMGREMTPTVESAINDFRRDYDDVLAACADTVTPEQQKCYESLLRRAGEEVRKALKDTLPKWRESFANAKRGHAAGKNSWLTELDSHPEWMARRPNNKGWLMSAEKIQQAIAKMRSCPVPHESTIDRERKCRLQEQ